MNTATIGHWAFVLGVVLAIFAGFGGVVPGIMITLFILGLIVGFLNITEKESIGFLVAVIALLVIGLSGLQLSIITQMIADIISYIIAFVSAAGLVVAIKQALSIAK